MQTSLLFELATPVIWVAEDTRSGMDSLCFGLRSDGPPCACRIIRGRKSRNSEAFFDEVSAALQFPEYFGENWNAFEDCLRDLADICPLPHFLFISQASQLLADEEDMLRVMLQMVTDTSALWQSVSSGPIPLKLVLQEDAANMPVLMNRLRSAGVTPASLADFPPR